jgi:hypothetical protein
MRSYIVGTLSALALLFTASAVNADTVTLQSDYAGFVGLKHNLTSFDGSPESTLVVSFDGSGASSFIGAYNWTVQSASNPDNPFSAGQSIYTYCIEKSQDFNVFDTYTFTVNPAITGSPLNGPDQGAINSLAALQLQGLISGHWNQSLTDNVSAAAFQLAVWEIEYDAGGRTDTLDNTPRTSDYYFASGRIEATATVGSTGSDAINLATTWLNTLLAETSLSTALALNSDTNQDHLTATAAVPLPAALPIGVAALAGLFAARKLRRRS